MKILNIAAEAIPFSSVGGLSSVITYLSKNLAQKGHDVRVFIPKFGFLDEQKYNIELVYKGLKVPTGYKKEDSHPTTVICNVKKCIYEGVVFYFLENMEYYEKRSNVYNYSDDNVRWALLSYGALQFICHNSGWVPDVVHAHDWHTALVPNILKTYYKDQDSFKDTLSVLTIHNLNFQGQDIDSSSELHFDDGKSPIPPFFSDRLRRLNYLRRGIIYSDIINTVSEGYARQIMTPEYGAGLDKLLLELRSKVFGVVNGIDYDKFNPATDPLVPVNYDIKHLESRAENKRKLQKEFNLEISDTVPLFAFVGRLDHQKGLDLIYQVLNKFLKDFNAQFVLVGSGDGGYERAARELCEKFPLIVGAHTYFSPTLPKLVFAGSDVVLIPSRFEPCGLVQMEAMRYGCIPLVRATGGLDDTVIDFDPSNLTGNGFKFRDFDGWSLYGQMVRALETFRNKATWKAIQLNAMASDYSWNRVADKYIDLYNKALYFKKEKFFDKY